MLKEFLSKGIAQKPYQGGDMFKRFKDKALESAVKLMQSEQAQKLVSSAEVQKAVLKAVKTGFKVKEDISNTRRVVVERLNIATGDDLVDLKRKLDHLERRVNHLKKENEHLREGSSKNTADG